MRTARVKRSFTNDNQFVTLTLMTIYIIITSLKIMFDKNSEGQKYKTKEKVRKLSH